LCGAVRPLPGTGPRAALTDTVASCLFSRSSDRLHALGSAFVSTGLIANFAEGQQVAYRFLLAESRRRGNTKAFTELSSLGSPPYAGADGIAKWRRCARWLGEFGALWHSSEKFDRVGWMLASIEYSWPEKLRFNRAAERSFGLLYADLLSVNLSETVPRVEVPVFFAEGRHDRMAPVEVAERYFTSLIAPRKELVWPRAWMITGAGAAPGRNRRCSRRCRAPPARRPRLTTGYAPSRPR
jgi:pimeloyl-ACP methyl ester carboxylesterase